MYIIERTELKQKKAKNRKGLIFATFFVIIFSVLLFLGEFEGMDFIYVIIIDICGIFYIKSTITSMLNLKKKEKLYDYLEVNGELIMNLPYKTKFLATEPNKIGEIKVVVEYEINPGETLELISDRKTCIKDLDSKTVNILIDPQNTEKYIINPELYEYKSFYSAKDVVN